MLPGVVGAGGADRGIYSCAPFFEALGTVRLVADQ
jgi:hypothetical protein